MIRNPESDLQFEVALLTFTGSTPGLVDYKH